MAPEPAARARVTAAAAVLLAVHALLAWLGRAPGVEASHDDARYILLGHALRHLAYENTWLAAPVPHTLYPPGYPAFIATFGWVAGDAGVWLILLNVIASTAALALTFRVLDRLWSPPAALAALAALATNPMLNERAGLIASEPVAMLAWVGALVLAIGERRRHRVAAGAVAIFAASVRAFALGVPFALAGHWLLQRRWRGAVALGAVTAAAMGGWILWTAQAGTAVHNVSYVAEVANANRESPLLAMGRRAVQHVAYYAGRDIPSGIGLPGIPGTPADNVVNAAIVFLGVSVGGFVLLRRWRPAALTLGFGLGVLAIWPWLEVRYLAPMMPVLVAALLMGIEAMVAWRLPRLARPAVLAAAVVLALGGLWRTSQRVSMRMGCDRTTVVPGPSCEPERVQGFFAAVAWLREHGEAGATVLAAKPATVHYFTGLPQADYGRANLVPPASFADFVRDQGIRYAILSGSHNSELVRLARRLEAVCARLRTAARFPPNGYVFEVVADTAGTDGCDGVRAYRQWGDATVRPDGEF